MNTTNTIVRFRIREIFFFSRPVTATASLRLLRLIGVIPLGPATLLSFLFCSLSLAFLSTYDRSRSHQSHSHLSHLPPRDRHFIHNGRPNRAIKYILHFCFIGARPPSFLGNLLTWALFSSAHPLPPPWRPPPLRPKRGKWERWT